MKYVEISFEIFFNNIKKYFKITLSVLTDFDVACVILSFWVQS